MADEADRAEQIQSDHIDRTLALRRAKQSDQPSAVQCVDCDEPIPERRRTLLPGVQRCVFCAEYAERQ